jgi:signal transduction histidine kinase
MLWISLAALRLAHAQTEAQRQGQVEENIRLALWRMDSTLSPLIAQETARPYFEYRAFMPAERAYTRMFNDIRADVLVASPLLGQEIPLVNLYFQIDPAGQITSPQAPAADELKRVSADAKLRNMAAAAAKLLDEVRAFAGRDVILAELPPNEAREPMAVQPQARSQLAQNANPPSQTFAQQQDFRNTAEFQARQGVNNSNYDLANNRAFLGDVRQGLIKPLWLHDQLLLVRRVTIDRQDYVQGCWLDWPAIQKALLDTAADLLPEASLQPAGPADADKPSRLLASIPAMVIPGAVPVIDQPQGVPLRMVLAVAWAGVVLAMSLSARRGAFVSAVTHELRTPLTTVSMYAEMLQGGMVSGEAREQYLATLRAEAERLGHLVENVLAYSRIERGGIRGRIQSIPLPQLIQSARQRLDSRAGQAGMQLVLHISPTAAEASVLADASAVEQILFNLVDNAAKYAASAADRRIEISADTAGGNAVICVRDHGPGIAPADARKLFRPFSKSARDAANSAPGVGLGLALSRRLARQMSGNLSLEQGDDQEACFRLSLPIAHSPS